MTGEGGGREAEERAAPTRRGIAEVDRAGKRLEGQSSPHLVDRGTGPARGRHLLYVTMTRAQDWA